MRTGKGIMAAAVLAGFLGAVATCCGQDNAAPDTAVILDRLTLLLERQGELMAQTQARLDALEAARPIEPRPRSWKSHWDRTWARYLAAGAVATLASANHIAWNNGWMWHAPDAGEPADGSWLFGNRQDRLAIAEEAAEDRIPDSETDVEQNGDGSTYNNVFICGNDNDDNGGGKSTTAPGLVFGLGLLALVF